MAFIKIFIFLLKKFEKVEKTGIISTKFSLRCTPSVILGTKVLFIDPKSFWASPNTFWSGPKYLDESASPANVNSSEFPVIPGSLMPNEGCKKQDCWVVFAIALESRRIQ